MISVMQAISHVVMLSGMAHSFIKTLHKIGFGYSMNIIFLTLPIKWSILMYQSASARSYLNDKYCKFTGNVEITHNNFTRNIFELVLLL